MSGSIIGLDGEERPGKAVLDRLVHELRTPLAAIQATADALGSGHLGTIGNERHAAYLQSIAETARHALAVLDTMLGTDLEAAPTETAPSEIDLARLVREVVGGMSLLAARSGIHLLVEEQSTHRVQAVARATDVRQMLINLVSNGIVHAGGGRTVRVSTETSDGPVCVRVTDNGAGIPQRILDCMSSRAEFDQAGDASRGARLRLGLTLTRALAEANGGRLEIVSGPLGTDARVLLPQAREPDAME